LPSRFHNQALNRAYALLSDPTRRARYDEFGAETGEEVAEDLQALGAWRTIKMPFTAFQDRDFYKFAERVGHIYILLDEEHESEGPFALELGGIKMGRCEKGSLPAAGFHGDIGCETGHCKCGYYNGWRVEGFEGPITDLPAREGRIMWGHAEHHQSES
jgi:curved DNA-binding protein CbpA|tara:strand:+ start:1949 stop:2425 length:477 start_codon:yes stop_codon:yes gene_type:complete